MVSIFVRLRMSSRVISHGLLKAFLITFLCLGTTTVPASGYTLQGPHVLELMVDSLSAVKTLRIDQQVVIENDAVADHPVQLKQQLSYSSPESFRIDSWFDNTNRIQVEVPGECLTVIDGRTTTDAATPLNRYKDLLLKRSRKLLHKTLLSYGVDVENTSLGRFQDRIVFVIGAQYPDESVSQVMVDKETFLPLRWLNILSTDPEERLDFVFGEWQQKNGLRYPMQIDVYHNQSLIRRIRVSDIEVNAGLPAETFDIVMIKRTYPPAEAADPSKTTNSPEDEVQQTIESFQKKFSNN